MVYIVEDDVAVQKSIRTLLGEYDYQTLGFDSAETFLEHYSEDWHGCLLLDIKMYDMDGLDLQEELIKRECKLPIIFLTGHGDIPIAVNCVRKGALNFLTKPFDSQELLASIQQGFQKNNTLSAIVSQTAMIRKLYATLSPREVEVGSLLVTGEPNKNIAATLNISVRTVEKHRSKIMQKMNIKSLAELVLGWQNVQEDNQAEKP